MENKKNRITIILFIFIGILVLFIYKVYKDISDINETMQSTTMSIPLYFKDVNQTIYISTRTWGLLGDHSCIFLSDEENDYPIEDKSFLFENTVLYYKIQYPDSLFIFLPSMSYSEEKSINKILGNIKIKITTFKMSKNKEYEEGYKKMGLRKIRVK